MVPIPVGGLRRRSQLGPRRSAREDANPDPRGLRPPLDRQSVDRNNCSERALPMFTRAAQRLARGLGGPQFVGARAEPGSSAPPGGVVIAAVGRDARLGSPVIRVDTHA